LEKDERQVAEWYNTLSGSYDELYGKEQSIKYAKVLEVLGDRHFRVLVDVGCGTGTFLKQAEKIYEYAIGIDLSTKMLRIARERGTPNTDYVLASSSSLPLRDDSSDGVVSISTAKAEQNLPGFIDGLERISQKNSFMALTVFQRPGATDIVTLSNPVESTPISGREILYLVRPGEG
jgi:ubiquinone/menaquinone biosynthesis C-methylase UbiE